MSKEIDGLIGVHLFGHTPSKVKGVLYNPPYYSANWGAAQFMIEQMEKRGFRVEIYSPDWQGCPWVALFCRQGENSVNCPKGFYESHADTLPMAVALAALKALGVEIGGSDADQG